MWPFSGSSHKQNKTIIITIIRHDLVIVDLYKGLMPYIVLVAQRQDPIVVHVKKKGLNLSNLKWHINETDNVRIT